MRTVLLCRVYTLKVNFTDDTIFPEDEELSDNMPLSMWNQYIKDISDKYRSGQATEQSYRQELSYLLANLITEPPLDIKTIDEPRRIEGVGTPDLRIYDGESGELIGYIETKDIGAPLDRIKDDQQIKRYREEIENLILTNFGEFILFGEGEETERASLFKEINLEKEFRVKKDKREKIEDLLNRFLEFRTPEVETSEKLAVILAHRARRLERVVDEILLADQKEDDEQPRSQISVIYDAFQNYLISEMRPDEFSDAYAQTICYGLFIARINLDSEELNKWSAMRALEDAGGVIRDLFQMTMIKNPPEEIMWSVEDIMDILNKTDLHSVFRADREREKIWKDPLFHFYEDFLREFNPQTRKRRGVFYTPDPVVNFITHSINQVLKSRLNLSAGLADKDVTLLDPASGTGTFLASAIDVFCDESIARGLSGTLNELISERLLENLHGFELLVAPYVVCHLKLLWSLREKGYTLKEGERLKVYLTNTLDPRKHISGTMPLTISISEEGKVANHIKTGVPILVILGNPPYSVSSFNKNDWIEGLMDDYKEAVRDERNIQPLSDDYIKFIRFGEWKMEQVDKGVFSYISNNSYLDGLIHRGMREHLMRTFDEIYILNLRGSARKGEVSPDGTKDENVFDIMQGVAIAIFIKTGERRDENARVFYQDLWGEREDKYRVLDRKTIETLEWEELEPADPYYFFVPKDWNLYDEYSGFWGVEEIFNEFSSGIATGRDKLSVAFEKNELISKIKLFLDDTNYKNIVEKLNIKEVGKWKISDCREILRDIDLNKLVFNYHYRPFDIRNLIYDRSIIQRGRFDFFEKVFPDNLYLLTTKQLSTDKFLHTFISNKLADRCLISIKTKELGYLFPLYLYENDERKSNIKDEYLKTISELYDREISPEEFFHYIYAVLHSPTYRERYEEFLRIDFPRVPVVSEYELFKRLSGYGEKLAKLHLMEVDFDKPIAKFPISGDNAVKVVKYDEKTGRVYINDEQYFEGVEGKHWDFYIGGYQVLRKWLRERKRHGRKLSGGDVETYQRIVSIVDETLTLMHDIDATTFLERLAEVGSGEDGRLV